MRSIVNWQDIMVNQHDLPSLKLEITNTNIQHAPIKACGVGCALVDVQIALMTFKFGKTVFCQKHAWTKQSTYI